MSKEGVEVVEGERCEEGVCGGVMSVKRVWLVGVWGCEEGGSGGEHVGAG